MIIHASGKKFYPWTKSMNETAPMPLIIKFLNKYAKCAKVKSL